MRTHVAVAILYNSEKNKVLISKRKNKQHLTGYWEFPGGKVESGEDIHVALNREMKEELGISVKRSEPLIKIKHDYPDKKVLLDVWKVYEWKGEPRSCENQEIVWSKLDSLESYKFPDANKIIVQSIAMKPVYVISQSFYNDYSRLYSVAEKCFSNGLNLFQLRLKPEKSQNLKQVLESLNSIAKKYKAKIILNGSAHDIENYTVDGIHLSSDELIKYTSRPIDESYLLGASCHNEKELIHASKLNVNYVFISPVKITSSHPEQAALGWNKFKRLAKIINLPVYALGGMTAYDINIARSNGAFGVAALSAIWGADSDNKAIESFKNSMLI